MNYKPIGNLRTTIIILAIAILAMGPLSAYVGVGPQLAQAGAATFTITHPNPNNNLVTTVTNNNPNGIRLLKVEEYFNGQLQGTRMARGVAACTDNVLGVTFKAISKSSQFLVFELDCAKKNWIQLFLFDGTSKTQAIAINAPPGTPNILIHEYLDTPFEMQAFENGDLDMVEWAVPDDFLDRWTNCASAQPIVCDGRAQLQKTVDLGMFEIDLNTFATPTSDPVFRHAVGYLVDRQTVVLQYAGGRAVPICAPAPDGQPGALGCVQLGYPTSFGDFNPAKALQVLYEGGYRDNDNDGILNAPNGVEYTYRLYARSDDPIRDQAGSQVANALRNLPNNFRSKATGLTVTVCNTATCGFTISEFHLPRSTIAPIVLRGTPGDPSTWNDWELYTGGWGLGFDPDQSFFLYSSGFAPAACGGGWPGGSPLNYPCNVDPTFDTTCEGQATGLTYADIVASAQACYRYGWGYDRTAGKITGTLPSVIMYTFLEEKAAWLRDYGTANVITNPDGSRACWTGFVGQELGTGIDNLATLTGMYLDNCQTGAGYQSYRTNKGAVLDWGFKSQVDEPNIVTSQWLWDALLLQQVYDSCIGRNVPRLEEIVPSACENFGESTYINTALGGIDAVVGVYHFRDGLMWSDGTFLTANDFKFSLEYTFCNNGWNFPFTEHIFDSDANCANGMDGIVVKDADPVNGIGGSAHVFFDGVGATLMQNAGFMPIIPQHVWCNSWPNLVADCAYADPTSFPAFDFSKAVGSGPYVMDSCTGADCGQTILLKQNPYYVDGTRWWNVPGRISVQPDVNRDDKVDQTDLDIVNALIQTGAQHPELDVDYRIVDGKKTQTVPIPAAFGSGSVVVSTRGPHTDALDRYIVQRFIMEASAKGALAPTWPPGRNPAYNWPDVDKDRDVDLDDVIGVYLNQFQAVSPPAANQRYNKDVDYDGDIDLDDLIIAFVRQFQKPFGVN